MAYSTRERLCIVFSCHYTGGQWLINSFAATLGKGTFISGYQISLRHENVVDLKSTDIFFGTITIVFDANGLSFKHISFTILSLFVNMSID